MSTHNDKRHNFLGKENKECRWNTNIEKKKSLKYQIKTMNET